MGHTWRPYCSIVHHEQVSYRCCAVRCTCKLTLACMKWTLSPGCQMYSLIDVYISWTFIHSSGSLLDEPLSTERTATPLYICAPTSDPSQPCQLHVDLSSLRGYTSSQLELTSTSRTTELYLDEDDYVGTARGSVAGNCDSDGYAPI